MCIYVVHSYCKSYELLSCTFLALQLTAALRITPMSVPRIVFDGVEFKHLNNLLIVCQNFNSTIQQSIDKLTDTIATTVKKKNCITFYFNNFSLLLLVFFLGNRNDLLSAKLQTINDANDRSFAHRVQGLLSKITQMKLHSQMITHLAAHAQHWCCKIFAVDYLLVTSVQSVQMPAVCSNVLAIYCNLFGLNVDKCHKCLLWVFLVLFSCFYCVKFFFSTLQCSFFRQLKSQLVQYAGQEKPKLLLVVAVVSADQRNDLSLRIKVTFLGISVVHRRFLST